MSRIYFMLLMAGLAVPAQAAIYKCINAEGAVLFTDNKRAGACKLVDSQSGSSTATPRKRSSQASNPSPANFPRVDKQTQSKRDDVRRALLLEERGNEERSLAATRATLSNGNKRSAAEQTKLEENQRLHEKNIEMLDRELARIK